MKGYTSNIEGVTRSNTTFRTVLYTGKYMQLVIMNITVKENIGLEVHEQDQFLHIESGEGEVLLDGVTHSLKKGIAVLIPAGATHNVINTGNSDLQLYSIYALPHHADGVVHQTKKDSETAEENHEGEYLGITTE